MCITPKSGIQQHMVESLTSFRSGDCKLMCIIPKSGIVLESLLEARNIVNKGWCQGQYVNFEKNQYCTVGAIMASARMEIQQHMVESFFEANGLTAVGEGASKYARMVAISNWNDAVERTKEEVVEAFNKAIESCLKY